ADRSGRTWRVSSHRWSPVAVRRFPWRERPSPRPAASRSRTGGTSDGVFPPAWRRIQAQSRENIKSFSLRNPLGRIVFLSSNEQYPLTVRIRFTPDRRDPTPAGLAAGLEAGVAPRTGVSQPHDEIRRRELSASAFRPLDQQQVGLDREVGEA